MLSRLASIRCLDEPLADIGSVQTEKSVQLLTLCRHAVQYDGADVLVIAGAPLAGLARQIRDQLPVPAVDGVSCAVSQAEGLFRLSPRVSTQGSFAPPPIKSNAGLPPAIAALMAARHNLEGR